MLRRLLPPLIVLLSRLVFGTCRIQFVDKQHEDRLLAAGKQILFAGLHEGMMLLPHHFRDRRGGLVMVSASRDGDLIADTIERFGLRAVRGSSGRFGGEALQAMIDGLRTNAVSGGIIVDGPKGPPLVAKAGAIVLARATGLAIVPGAWWTTPILRVKSWDRTIVPLPFGRIVFAFEVPLLVAPDMPDADIEAVEPAHRRLLAARTKAQEAVARGRRA
jgi:lysophospholipid acyltransferase (LPLAT)-like uncharacterized protein